MRILFDSKKTEYKSVFGCLAPKQDCILSIHIPATVRTSKVEICVEKENGECYVNLPMALDHKKAPYEIWQGTLHLEDAGLYFYYFRITGHTGTFRLFKQGDGTNMEAGDKWQVSCIPDDFTTPDWAKGAIIYQLFPDRFRKAGDCDLTGKLKPYILHENWNDEVIWQPNEKGQVLNNDFYGGNLRGITEKLSYIASLGTTILYLNPICMAFSSHRYDTADYKRVDPLLGTEEDFKLLCHEAHKLGMKVILDGVFSHTGADSLYFDKYKSFGGNGAYNSKKSPYINWYAFQNWPDKYACWWDFDTLPTVNKMHPDFIEYIITGEDSVIAHWLKLGADGFRLDVADELPDAFLHILKTHLRKLRPDALLMGEVWEDASNKIAYGVRRRYFTDGQLDSIMNYPFRTAILNFMWQKDGQGLKNTVLSILENYPRQAALCNMNLLGTHDTKRILTALVDDFEGSRRELANRKLAPWQTVMAKKRLMLASLLQYTLPGSPSLYYGDEAGMEGGKDPFNRRTFPWGREDLVLTAHFQKLGQLRKHYAALRLGDTEFTKAGNGEIEFIRRHENTALRIYVNLNGAVSYVPEGRVVFTKKWEDAVCYITEER